MAPMLKIYCKNNGQTREFEMGSTLLQIYKGFELDTPEHPVCAVVNNRLEGLTFRVFCAKDVEYLDNTSEPGRKVYQRSLSFVLYKAVKDLFPEASLTIEAPVSHGYYFLVRQKDSGGHAMPMTLDMAEALKKRMQTIIAEGHHFHRKEDKTAEVVSLFRRQGLNSKARLIEGQGRLYSYYYLLDGVTDYYYGPLVPSTDYLNSFDLVKYYDGLLLRIPQADGRLPEILKQEKMLKAFRDDHILEERIGVTTVGELNHITDLGYAGEAIKVAEALQEKRISRIADEIAARKGVKMVLIAGPSSSGKTTFSKRLSVQLMACGLMPMPISLDEYFVDREKTPRDEQGEYDYESIYALDLDLFNRQLQALLRGEDVELPHYDFATGTSKPSGNHVKLKENTILILEGIHGLNPLMSEGIPEEAKFKIYVSALTSIKLDDHNYIPTTDNRLIRRIVRDYKYRGASAQSTIARWPSVRRGEDKWIFPYQENADVMFNSALIYELAVLRNQALPLLESVHEDCPEHVIAAAMACFLKFFTPISDAELPPTSLLREFLGGSSFHY